MKSLMMKSTWPRRILCFTFCLAAMSGIACIEDPTGVLSIEFGLVPPETIEIPTNGLGQPIIEPTLVATAGGVVSVDAVEGMVMIDLTGIPAIVDSTYQYELWMLNHHGVEEHEPGQHGDGGHGKAWGGPGSLPAVEETDAIALGKVALDSAGRYELMMHRHEISIDLEHIGGCMLVIVREGEVGPGEHVLLFGKLGTPASGGQSEPPEGDGGGHGGGGHG